jgi:ParB/RepB/Spo0J family partition protein
MAEQPLDAQQVALGPRTVHTNSLIPNPHNPRLLFDELPLRTLEESIRRVGVLVPITVFQATGSQKYTILDGQRRWICAQRIGLADVPINQVAEPTVAQNIVTMFQIHKLRKDWELMPTALKLEVLMSEMDERRDAQLADLTGLDVAVVTRCKKLLSYEKRYQEMMLYADPEDRIKADFFIELYPIINDRLVTKATWYNKSIMIDAFLDKCEGKKSGFKSVTDFRKVKQHITVARLAGHEAEILDRLHKLMTDDSFEIEDLEIDTAKVHRQASNLVKSVSKLMAELKNISAESFLGEEDLWGELEQLAALVAEKLNEADRRLQ